MRTKPDEIHTVKMNVAPGVWAYVDKTNARVLRFGGVFALVFGVIGGTVLMSLLDTSHAKEPFIIFSIGYGGAGIVGFIVGLIVGAVTKAPEGEK